MAVYGRLAAERCDTLGDQFGTMFEEQSGAAVKSGRVAERDEDRRDDIVPVQSVRCG